MRGTPDAYPFRTLSAPVRFAIALGAISIVFVIDRAAGATIDDGSKFLLMGTAVMASAWFAGTGPALAATVLGAVLGAFEAAGQPGNAAVPTHLALFVVQGLLLTAVISELRSARRSAERQATRCAGGAARRGCREPDEGRVPRDGLPRTAHAAQRRPRLGVPAADRKARRADVDAGIRVDRSQRAAAGAAHGRSARRLEGADGRAPGREPPRRARRRGQPGAVGSGLRSPREGRGGHRFGARRTGRRPRR